MKNLTKVDVLNIAAAIITANGEATTLEIKNEARNQGFWAKQAEVSGLVSELINEDQLAVKGDNGIHRFYEVGVSYNTPVAPVVATASTPVTQTKPTTPSYTVTHLDGTQTIVKALTQNLLKAGDWEVSSTHSTEVLHFLGQLTRDKARSAYRSITGVKFATTRSKRTE